MDECQVLSTKRVTRRDVRKLTNGESGAVGGDTHPLMEVRLLRKVEN